MPEYGSDWDVNRESQMANAQQDEANQTILQTLNARLSTDPRIRAFMQSRQGRELTADERRQLTELVQASGYRLPDNTRVESDGSVRPINHDTRNRILTAAMLAPLALPGGGGAAGASGASGAGGGASGLASSSYVVPNAALGSSGGVPGMGGMAGLAGSDYVVPSAALGPNGGMGSSSSLLSRLDRLRGLGDLGDLFSSMSESRANGRAQDDLANLRAASENNRSRVSVGQFNLDAPMTRAQQVARGDLMAATIPRASISGSGRNLSYVGGVDPTMFGPNTREAGRTLSNTSLEAMRTNSDRIEPQLVTPSRPGMGENLTGGLGLGLNILDTLRNMRRNGNGGR